MKDPQAMFDWGQAELEPTFGTDPIKLARAESPPTSKIAASAVNTTKLEQMVFEAIESFGVSGCISDEVRAMFPDKSYSSITARYRALHEKELITYIGTRPGASTRPQRIMVAKYLLKGRQ